MADKHLSPRPFKTYHKGKPAEHAWFYEEPQGLAIVVMHHDKNGDYVSTETFHIRWGYVRRALKRKDRD